MMIRIIYSFWSGGSNQKPDSLFTLLNGKSYICMLVAFFLKIGPKDKAIFKIDNRKY